MFRRLFCKKSELGKSCNWQNARIYTHNSICIGKYVFGSSKPKDNIESGYLLKFYSIDQSQEGVQRGRETEREEHLEEGHDKLRAEVDKKETE